MPGVIAPKVGGERSEEIPRSIFGEKMRGFVEQWASDLDPIVAKREVALWGSFFTSRVFWYPNKMSIQRYDSPFVFEAEVMGSAEQLSNLCRTAFRVPDLTDKTFEEDARKLTDSGLKTKEKVSIYAKNSLYPYRRPHPSPYMACNLQRPFSHCLEENRVAFSLFGINPLAVREFSLAPSVAKMTQRVDTNLPVMQHFSEEGGEPVREYVGEELARRPDLVNRCC